MGKTQSTDPALDLFIVKARERLEQPLSGDDSIGNAEPDEDMLALASGAPPKLKELLEIAARLWHVDLGLWEIWHGHVGVRGVQVRGALPDGFVAEDAIQIGVATDTPGSILLTWSPGGYGTFVQNTKSKKVEATGNFTELLVWLAKKMGEKTFKGSRVKDSMFPVLLAELDLHPWA